MFLTENANQNDIAIIDNNGQNFLYKDIDHFINEFSLNFPKRYLVFNLCGNDLESIICYLSCLKKGCASLLLSENIKDNHLEYLINIYKPQYIFSNERNLKNYEIVSSYKNKKLYKFFKFENIKLNEKLSLLLTTSGTTGSPKLVKITNQNLISNAKSICEYLKITKSDRSITSLPFQYSYGLSVINSHFFVGGSIVLSKNSMIEKKFWSDVYDYEITNIAGVPYNYEIILKLGLKNLNIPSVRLMTQAGGKLSHDKISELNDYFKLENIKFCIMYGQTEATARISYLPFSETAKRVNCIGKAVPGGYMFLEDKMGKIIKTKNVVGEIIYKGPNVSMGYANSKEDLITGDVNCGVLKTGDLGYFDEKDYFYLKGKSTRFIKVFGNRVSLDSLESIIEKNGFRAIVVGKDDEITIYLKRSIEFSKEKFFEILSKETTINIRSFNLILLKDFPRLETGKIDYKKLFK